jgi:hypothetical protein
MLNDEIDNEENPYTIKGMGTKNILPIPKPGYMDIKPWNSLKRLDFVNFEGLKVWNNKIVYVKLETEVGLVFVMDIREDPKNHIYFKLIWAYSKKDVPNGWPDDSLYILSNYMEAHKSDVIMDCVTKEEVKQCCKTYFFSYKYQNIRQVTSCTWMKKYINLVISRY